MTVCVLGETGLVGRGVVVRGRAVGRFPGPIATPLACWGGLVGPKEAWRSIYLLLVGEELREKVWYEHLVLE